MLKTRKMREAELAAQRAKRTKVGLWCTSFIFNFLTINQCAMLLRPVLYTKKQFEDGNCRYQFFCYFSV